MINLAKITLFPFTINDQYNGECEFTGWAYFSDYNVIESSVSEDSSSPSYCSERIIAAVNSALGETDLWPILPIVMTAREVSDFYKVIKSVFPNTIPNPFKQTSFNAGQSVYYNGKESPVFGIFYYPGPDSAIGDEYGAKGFRVPFTDNSFNYVPVTIQTTFLRGYGSLIRIPIFPTNYLKDGKFNLPQESVSHKVLYIRVKADYWDLSGYRVYVVTETFNFMRSEKTYNFFNGKEFPNISVGGDPFNPGGGSGTGGGTGDFGNTSTPIEIPNLPSVSAASTGFISLFNPTLSQLNELASYLWSDLFEINGWKKLFANPMDAILGLSILPVQIPTSGPKEVKVGNIGTGKSLNVASTQFVEVDCGSINVNEYWGAYLDYSPYTQCQIYLPYVGTRPISVDEIMGKTINVKYHVDILTGACCCFIKCGDSVLYTFNGQCSIPIPINSANYTSVINGIISVAASVGSMVATGGASAPLAIPHLASTVANQMKPNIEKSGAISGSGGVLNIQTPYLILTRPRQALPSKQNTFTGYPSFITVTLGELSGYTEVYSIHLENISATADELSEIETLLKGGVIF